VPTWDDAEQYIPGRWQSACWRNSEWHPCTSGAAVAPAARCSAWTFCSVWSVVPFFGLMLSSDGLGYMIM